MNVVTVVTVAPLLTGAFDDRPMNPTMTTLFRVVLLLLAVLVRQDDEPF